MKNIEIILKEKKNSGIAVLFAILVLGIILSTTLALSVIFIPKIRLSFDVKNSPSAIHAADTGVEWCLYNFRKGTIFNPPVFLNGATFSINGKDSPVSTDCVSPVKSIGRLHNSTRSLEVSF